MRECVIYALEICNLHMQMRCDAGQVWKQQRWLYGPSNGRYVVDEHQSANREGSAKEVLVISPLSVIII